MWCPTVNQPHDPNVTTDVPAARADSPDPGLTGAFDTSADPNATTDHARGSASTQGSQPGADVPAPDLPAVPGYRVLRVIARGGMGRVFAAVDLTLDRAVPL